MRAIRCLATGFPRRSECMSALLPLLALFGHGAKSNVMKCAHLGDTDGVAERGL